MSPSSHSEKLRADICVAITQCETRVGMPNGDRKWHDHEALVADGQVCGQCGNYKHREKSVCGECAFKVLHQFGIDNNRCPDGHLHETEWWASEWFGDALFGEEGLCAEEWRCSRCGLEGARYVFWEHRVPAGQVKGLFGI